VAHKQRNICKKRLNNRGGEKSLVGDLGGRAPHNFTVASYRRTAFIVESKGDRGGGAKKRGDTANETKNHKTVLRE